MAAIQIKYTNRYSPRPRALIYGDPGDGKTSLCATLETPGQKDIMFAFTEGGVQSISHLALPYMELSTVDKWDDLIAFFKSGKCDGDGGIVVGGHRYQGLVVDLYSEFVQMTLIDLIRQSPRAEGNLMKVIDDPSEYEYKKLNFKMLRQIRELRNLPLKYVVFTSYVQEFKDKQMQLTKSMPAFIGTKIWVTVAGSMDYVFRVSPPRSATDALKKRVIRTQPSSIHYAKARVPGVAGNLPLPAEIDYPLGHTTMLTKIFGRVEDYIIGNRKLEAKSPVPTEIEETLPDAEATPVVAG